MIALVLAFLGFSQSRFDPGGPSLPAPREAESESADAPAPDVGPSSSSAAEDALLEAINRARHDHRLPELRESTPLGRAARAHSADLTATSRCSHDGSDGSSLDDRLAAETANLTRYGEVVACGSASADAAVAQWLGSKAHRDILLGRTYRTVGVGVALGAGAADARWTAVLGTP